MIKSENVGLFKCVACSSKFRKAVTLEAHVNRCDEYKYLKLSNITIHNVNERESVSPEKARALAGNEGSSKSEMKMNQGDELAGDSNQLTLEETCSTLLDLLENVAGKNGNESNEGEAMIHEGTTETNDDSYIMQKEGIEAELDQNSPVEKAQSTLMKHHSLNHIEAPFACHICSENFSTNDSLGKHSLQHLQKSFKCEQCSKIFTNIQQVKAHEIRHKLRLI